MIYENVRRLCREHGMTIWALERELGLGNGVIGKWRDANPRIDIAKKVADYFCVTVDELLREERKEE